MQIIPRNQWLSIALLAVLGASLGGCGFSMSQAKQKLEAGGMTGVELTPSHTRTARHLARRFGGRVTRPRIATIGVRPLAAIAHENLVHGAIGETYGALVNHHQARSAADPEVRAAFRAIAPDETRHASLALAVHRWIVPRLSPSERAILEREFDAAFARMIDAARPRDVSLVTTSGLPDRPAAQRLMRALAAALRPHLAL